MTMSLKKAATSKRVQEWSRNIAIEKPAYSKPIRQAVTKLTRLSNGIIKCKRAAITAA